MHANNAFVSVIVETDDAFICVTVHTNDAFVSVIVHMLLLQNDIILILCSFCFVMHFEECTLRCYCELMSSFFGTFTEHFLFLLVCACRVWSNF